MGDAAGRVWRDSTIEQHLNAPVLDLCGEWVLTDGLSNDGVVQSLTEPAGHTATLGCQEGAPPIAAGIHLEERVGEAWVGLVLWTDGGDWSPLHLPTSDTLADVALSGVEIVAVGSGGLWRHPWPGAACRGVVFG